jgi:hypothetical protein
MSGWLDQCSDRLPAVDALVEPSVNQPDNMWRSTVLSKKKEIIEERLKNLPICQKQTGPNVKYTLNEVKCVYKKYIDQHFEPSSWSDTELIDATVAEFNLNVEQERAFQIIANHATLNSPDKLQMYLGGMGRTGKSQVIKVLIHFFKARNKEHRFLVVAPTGSAAALLNGSTYHSVLGINERGNVTACSLAQVKSRLDGVDYIFFNEVSMLSYRDIRLVLNAPKPVVCMMNLLGESISYLRGILRNCLLLV